jgi:hypothetical protein
VVWVLEEGVPSNLFIVRYREEGGKERTEGQPLIDEAETKRVNTDEGERGTHQWKSIESTARGLTVGEVLTILSVGVMGEGEMKGGEARRGREREKGEMA